MKLGNIGFWTHIAWLFLIRSGRSTAALSIMMVTAVSVLIFLSALSVGVNDAMLRNTVGLFPGHITGHQIAGGIQPDNLKAKGAEAVLKRVYLPGTLLSGDLSQPLMICGINPRLETAFTALHQKIIEGRYPQNGQPELLLSKLLAKKLGVQTGATLFFTPQAQSRFPKLTVSGIYQTGIDQLDREIVFLPLNVMPEKGTPWSAAIFLQNDVNPKDIIDGYKKKWPGMHPSGKYRFESWETTMPDLRQLIDLETISMSIVMILVFAVVAIGIACTFVIFIIKNMHEYGVMRAIGVTTREMSLLIMIKVALMNGIACGIGLLAGCIAVWGVSQAGGIDITTFTSHNRYFAVSGVIYPRLTVFSLLMPPVISFLFSLAAALWPVVLLARKKTADILRMV